MKMQPIGALAAKIVDPWAWYFAALKNPGEIGKSIPLHHEPHQGYFRTRRKGGQWEAVAIFYPEGSNELVAYRSGREVPADEVWTYCATNPITYEQYQAALEGKGFEDEPPAPAIGDNSGDADPFEQLRIEYLGEKELAEEFMKQPVTTQAQADKVAIWAKRLTAIKTKAEGFHKVEKQPHLDAGRAVDDKWRDLKTEPDDLAKRLKAHIKPFLQEQIRQEEERQRKAREAEIARRQAEEAELHAKIKAAQEAEARDQEQIDALIKEAEQKAQQPPVEVEARKVNAGRTGARVSMRVEKIGVVTDYAKAAAALVAMRHKDLIAVVDQLAQRAAKAGMPFDGMEIREEEKVV